MFTIKQTTPEQAGIPSSAILAMINRLEREKIPMHSILMMRQDQLVLESYYAPCCASSLHRMFSITKSFTSVAIGLLEQQGLINLDDPISIYFPEMLPPQVHPWITEMTIRDLLMMRTCHATTTYKKNPKKNWVSSFFTTKPTHPAGKFFHYDTSATHVLAALVEKLSGTELLTFLKENCLNELAFSSDSYIIKDPFGTSMGGSGLMATSLDLLKFGYLLSHAGCVDGKQLINAKYLNHAMKKQTETIVTAPCQSEAQGYGYQIWRSQYHSHVCYGMGGQLIILLPEVDLICVTTADTQGISGGNQAIYQALYDEVIPFLSPLPLTADNNEFAALTAKTYSLVLPSVSDTLACCQSEFFINSSPYLIQPNDWGYQSFALSIDPASGQGRLLFTNQDKNYWLSFGIGNIKPTTFPKYNFACAASGNWLTDQTFYIKAQIIDQAVGSVHFQLAFGNGDLTVFIRKQIEASFDEFDDLHLYGKIK